MAGKKHSPPPTKQDEHSEDEDDVPLARILQRRRPAAKASLKKQNSEARAASTATRRKKANRLSPPLLLSEVAERSIIEFLLVVPDRLRVEAVCRRWRRMSREQLPVTELDFSQVGAQPSLRRDVSAMIERASQQLTRLMLPDITLVDAHVELIVQQEKLCVFRAHRMQKKHIFNILKHCRNLETLELLDCRALTLSGWPRDAVVLRKVCLNGCNFVTNHAASSLITVCGSTLEKVIFTEATCLDSQIFGDLARHAIKLEELTISNCNNIRLRDLEALTESLRCSLRWLDLSSCRGISSFPDATSLPQLQVLILDKSKINDDGLRGISQVAPSLRYLSLQDCRAISDEGVTAIASFNVSEGCTNLELVDLKGTPVTDSSLEALEAHCPRLQLVLTGSRLSKCEQIFAERKKIEMIDLNKSSSESDDNSGSDQDDDYVVGFRRNGVTYRT